MKLQLELIAARLRREVPNLVLLDAMDSTHSMALRLMEQMDNEGLDLAPTVILSGRQSAGRGRGARRWVSSCGGLYLSWLRSGVHGNVVPLLPMLAAAAAHHALQRLGIGRAAVKWPNDLLVGRHKIAGILVHARHGDTLWTTVGLGLNVLAAPPIDEPGYAGATSVVAHLDDEGAASEYAATFAGDFVSALHAAIADPPPALARWRAALVHRIGDAMTLRLASGETLSGSLVEVTDEGFLRIAGDSGERTVSGGDVIESG